MTASTALFQLIMVSQIWIYVPCLLMIVQDQTTQSNDPNMIPSVISVVSGNYVGTLTPPYDSL